jgi:environmental stress-induced protein Ves
MADISADGPFSSFPGVERWFAVVTGNGVILELDGVERRLAVGDAPLQFDGAAAPGCRLIDGPTRDLNLMARGGRSGMRAHRQGEPWNEGFRVRALFTAVPGRWWDGDESRDLAEHTLLWDDTAAGVAWQFEPSAAAPVTGWWLGYSP